MIGGLCAAGVAVVHLEGFGIGYASAALTPEGCRSAAKACKAITSPASSATVLGAHIMQVCGLVSPAFICPMIMLRAAITQVKQHHDCVLRDVHLYQRMKCQSQRRGLMLECQRGREW